jgi:hypothetical protein
MVPGLRNCESLKPSSRNGQTCVIPTKKRIAESQAWHPKGIELQRRLGHATLAKMLGLQWQSDAPQQVCKARIGAKDIQMRVCAKVKRQKA